MSGGPTLADAMAGLRKRMLPAWSDAVRGIGKVRTDAVLAQIVAALDAEKWELLVAMGSNALVYRDHDVSPLAREALNELGNRFPLAWNFDEMVAEPDEYCTDGRLPLQIECAVWLPRMWEEWDEIWGALGEQNAFLWSLPCFWFASDCQMGPEDWENAAVAFDWPEDLAPKWWRGSGEFNLDERKLRERLEDEGMGDYWAAYQCVFCMGENLFIDWDNGYGGDMVLPELSLENVRLMEDEYARAQVIIERAEAACQAVADDPEVLVRVMGIYNGCLKPRRRARTLVELWGGR